MNKLFTLGRSLFNRSKGKHALKHAESHRREENTLGALAYSLALFS